MIAQIAALIAFLLPLYLLSEVYYLVKVKTIDKVSLIKIGLCVVLIAIAFIELNTDQIKVILVYLAATIIVVTVVLLVIRMFKTKH
jgi:hypothetical protein